MRHRSTLRLALVLGVAVAATCDTTAGPLTASPVASDPTAFPAPAGELVLERFDDPAIFGGPGVEVLRAAAPAGDGFVILGDAVVDRTSSQGAWLTPDGRAWERIRDVPDLARGTFDDVAELANRTVLAVGMRDVQGGAAWRSIDGGRTWESIAGIPGVALRTRLVRVAPGPRGAVVLGSQASNHGFDDSRLWWTDGAAWRSIDVAAPIFERAQIRDVVAVGDAFVAVGGRRPEGEAAAGDPLRGERAAAWRSDDGLTWEAVRVPDAPPLLRAFPAANGLLGVGYSENASDTVDWLSSDGTEWQPFAPSARPDGPIVRWNGRLHLLAGPAAPAREPEELFTSDDGIAWRSAGPTSREGSGGTGAIVAGEPGILQLGSEGDDAVVWLLPWPD